MFSDEQSLSAALEMLHPEIEASDRAEAVKEMLQEGSGAAQVGLLSLIKIFQSFICGDDQYRGFEETFSKFTDEQTQDSPTLGFLKKAALAGITAEEITHFVRGVQFDLLDEVCLSLDNNVNYEHVPYSEFGVYLINTHTNEPEVLVDGLHENVEGMKEDIGYED